VHNLIGGWMATMQSPLDPIFFLNHCYKSDNPSDFTTPGSPLIKRRCASARREDHRSGLGEMGNRLGSGSRGGHAAYMHYAG
jgi:hypothetical protein